MSVRFKETVESNVQGGMGGMMGNAAANMASNMAGNMAGGMAGNMAGGMAGNMPNMGDMGNMAANMATNMAGGGFTRDGGPYGGGFGRGGAFTGPQNMSGARGDGKHQHHGFVHDTGEFLTRGGSAGGYLQNYLDVLDKYPLRTKMLTSGSLAGLQELVASYIAQDRSKHGHYFSSRIPKMMAYGALVSAPLGHLLFRMTHFLFSGKSSLKVKIAQIALSNLIISPIQNSIYLIFMALIAGARTFHQVRATIRAGFWPVMRVTWISSPIALAFAEAFLPEQTWVIFFNFLAFCIGTYINTITKKKRLAALRRKYSEGRGGETLTESAERYERDY